MSARLNGAQSKFIVSAAHFSEHTKALTFRDLQNFQTFQKFAKLK